MKRRIPYLAMFTTVLTFLVGSGGGSGGTSAAPSVGKQVITPMDIEDTAGITGGNIFQGELLLHQLFFLRPAPQWADFRTPLPGYYHGGSGAHPGGGIMGANGQLAAMEVLKDWR